MNEAAHPIEDQPAPQVAATPVGFFQSADDVAQPQLTVLDVLVNMAAHRPDFLDYVRQHAAGVHPHLALRLDRDPLVLHLPMKMVNEALPKIEERLGELQNLPIGGHA
jgi:hypothetical protein